MADRMPSADPDVVASLVRAGLKVLVLSAMTSPAQVRAVVRAGVHGVVGKRDAEADVIGALRSVLGGEQWMTPELAVVIASDVNRPRLSGQEERALVLYASGLTLPQVAEAIGVRPDTAKQYLTRVTQKYAALGRPARSKVDLHRAAREDRLLDPTADGHAGTLSGDGPANT